MKLWLPQALADKIGEESRKALPREACGLLIGQDFKVRSLVSSPNLADEAERFEIDPRIILQESRLARERKEEIIGHYHSHPNGRPYPSATDLARAFYPEWLWLIWANGEPRAFKIEEDNYQEVEIIMLPA